MLDDIKNNGNYKMLKNIFSKFNKENKDKVINVVLLSMRTFNRTLLAIKLLVSNELDTIIGENGQKESLNVRVY